MVAPVLAGVSGVLLGALCQRSVGTTPDAAARQVDGALPSSGAGPVAKPVPPEPGATARLLRDVSTLSAEECEARILQYLESGKSGQEIELEALFRRWLSLEPAEKILERLSDPERRVPSQWATAFFRAWVAIDEKAAMNDKESTRFQRDRALHAMGIHDPSFINHLKGESDLLKSESPLRMALFSLGRDAPDLARSLADADLSPDFKARALVTVAQGWASGDPIAALAWARTLDPAKEPGRSAFHAVMEEWSKRDLEAAREAWKKEPLPPPANPPASRFATVAAPLLLTQSGFASGHIAAALARDPFLDVAGLHAMLSEATDIDWEKPGHFASAIDRDGWYPADPAAAAKEAEKLPPGQVRDRLMALICDTWATHDLEAASTFAGSRAIGSSYIATLKSAPTPEMRRRAFAKPGETFAALFAADSFSEGDKEPPRLYELAKEWTARDPEAAAKWLAEQELPSGGQSAREMNLSLLFSNTVGYHWARTDPVGATQWVDSLPEGPLKSAAWGQMHERVAEYSPDYAFTLGAAWSQGEFRMQRLEADLKAVSEKIGHPLALELLNTPGISAEERAILGEALRSAGSK